MQVTCCLNTLAVIAEFGDGPAGSAALFSGLPIGCLAPVCDITVLPTVGGGASLIIAMPVAIVMSLLLALVAVL